MNCRDARELFSDYADERLAPAQLQALSEHVSACANCAAELEELRATVSLMGSLAEVEPSPDFLARVNQRIDERRSMNRWWRFVFAPRWIKLPLEAAALATVVIFALYVYRRAPERFEDGLPLSQNNSESRQQGFSGPLAQRAAPRPPDRSSDANKTAPEPKPETVEATKRAPGSDAIASLNVPSLAGGAPAGSAHTQPQGQEAAQVASALAPYKAPTETTAPATIVEVAADDVTAFENRLGAILSDFGAKITKRQSSEDGVTLSVELPRSREADFYGVVSRESRARSSSSTAPIAKPSMQPRSDGALPAAQRFVSKEKAASAAPDDPDVAIDLRIRRKSGAAKN